MSIYKFEKKKKSLSNNDISFFKTSKNDQRLLDPRYEDTYGDVLIFNEPKRHLIWDDDEPKPKSTPPYRPPGGVFCQKISESISSANYCKSICKLAEFEPCMPRP